MSIRVQSWVWENSKADGSSLLLLLAIADHSHDDGTGAYPSVATLAAKCRQTERNTQLLLRKLESSGEIITKRQQAARGTNEYVIPVPWGEKISGVKTSANGVKTGVIYPHQFSPEPSITIKEPSCSANAENHKSIQEQDADGLAEFEQIPSVQRTAPKRELTAEERLAVAAGDFEDKKQWRKTYAPVVQTIMGRDGFAQTADKVAVDRWRESKIVRMAGHKLLNDCLRGYCNGNGDKFRHKDKAGNEPTPFWILSELERDLIPMIQQKEIEAKNAEFNIRYQAEVRAAEAEIQIPPPPDYGDALRRYEAPS